MSDGSIATLDASGKAISTFTATTAGITTLSASYAGDNNNAAANGSASVTVARAAVQMTLGAEPTTLSIGGQVRTNLG